MVEADDSTVNSTQIVKRALLIVAAVAGYFLLDAVLLLSVIVPRQSGLLTPPPYAPFVGFSQLVLIPGMAVLFSRIIYGPQKWGRRCLLIFLTGPFVLLAVITPFVVIVILLDWTFIVSKILFAIAMMAIYATVLMGLRWCIRRSRQWSVEAEAARWLAERQSGIVQRDVIWRNRGIRFATCVPALLVLPLFLFLPEVWGMLSHLGATHSGDLAGYRVPIPATWIVLRHDNQSADGWSTVTGLAGRGIGRGIAPYLSRRLPFSSWAIETDSYDPSKGSPAARWRRPSDDEVTSRRSLMIGADSIACLDYWPAYLRTGPHQQIQQFDDLSVAYIECSNGRRFRAGFFGIRGQVATFYEMLGRTIPK